MQEDSVFNPLQKISRTIEMEHVSGKQAADFFEQAVEYFLHVGVELTDENKIELKSFIPVMERLVLMTASQIPDCFYYQAVLAFVKGNFVLYYKKLEKYIQSYPESFKWNQAEKRFFRMISFMPTLAVETAPSFEHLTAVLANYAAKYYPESALELYCKSLYLQETPLEKLKLLEEVIKKEEGWVLAWMDEGDLYQGQKKWIQALEAYKRALEILGKEKNKDYDEYLFFQAAYVSDKRKDLDSAVDYYKKCIEKNPAYPYAQNNLGYCYSRQKRYGEAEPHLKYAVEHDENNRYACRNLYCVLERLHKTEELRNLVKKYPKHFNTKEYRAKPKNYLPEEETGTMEELQALLQKKTTNNYAGTIMVSSERSNLTLYNHQKDAIQSLKKWKNQEEGGAGLLVLPTGGGKTLTAVYWLMQDILDQGGKVLWVAHRHELLDQALQGFRRVCYEDLSPHKKSYSYRMISGQHDKSVHIQPEDDILIASKSSLAHNLSYIQQNWIEKNKNRICMVIDEAHHTPAGEYRKLIHLLQEYGGSFRLLGLTATPFRTVEKEQGLLKKLFFNDILYKIDLRTLIERGILADPVFHSVKTEINMEDLFHTGNADDILERIRNERNFDFDTPGTLSKEAARLIAEHSGRNRLIVDTYVKDQQKYGRTVVFAVNVDMAIAINALFQERGIRSAYIVSNTRDPITGVNRSKEDNREALRRFRAGELDVLVNVNIITEGTDLPKVQSVFLTRPTKSKILMTQMIGRALRGEKAGGTAKAYIVSFLDKWQEQIAWVNPEKLYIDTNADFEEQTSESRKYAMRLVSIAKLEEFTKLADDTLDRNITDGFSFLERIPVGLYQFEYLPDGEEESRNCTILVYDCMREAYEELMQWLSNLDAESLEDLDAVASHIDHTLFRVRDHLLGYQYQDIYDILAFYHQKGVLPQWIPLEERKEYDVAVIAQNILEYKYNRWEEDDYITSEWERADGKWAAFFGYQNVNAFTAAIDLECRRLVHPERYQPPKLLPITCMEELQIQNLPLEEIRRRYPEIGEKLRNAVFEKYQDEEGYYFSAGNGFRSKSKLDFQIDHIKPMAQGGLTCLDNLQLLTRYENAVKKDHFKKEE